VYFAPMPHRLAERGSRQQALQNRDAWFFQKRYPVEERSIHNVRSGVARVLRFRDGVQNVTGAVFCEQRFPQVRLQVERMNLRPAFYGKRNGACCCSQRSLRFAHNLRHCGVSKFCNKSHLLGSGQFQIIASVHVRIHCAYVRRDRALLN
jgi:hypothetical protein